MKLRNIILPFFAAITLLSGQTSKAQCPSIEYPLRSTQHAMVTRGWDTCVTCINPTITLQCSTFITPQVFGNNYRMDPIPYNPPDTTFHSTTGGGSQITLNSDDNFETVGLQTLPFSFVFFGNSYNQALVGPNGTITFNTNLVNTHCPYNASTATYALPSTATHLVNSILGLYEDIDTRYISNTGVPNAGVYRAVYDAYPCRKLVVSYHAIPKFGHSSATEAPTHYSTTQIVCYEGTNIIEVHIKRHSALCGTDGNCCIVGINNSTGTVAYPATARNPLNNQDITTPEAWRWTPQGTTIRNIQWYYGSDTSSATGIQLFDNDSITVYNDGFGGDTAIRVSPSVPTSYTARMRYIGANGIKYDLATTIMVGVNKEHAMAITGDTIICKGESTTITLNNPPSGLTVPNHNAWTCDNPRLRYSISGNNIIISQNQAAALFMNQPYSTMPEITATFAVTTEFSNGCNDSASIRLHFYNRIDDTIYANICDGESYTFHGEQFTSTGTHSVDTTNAAGCPYTNTLRLAVYHPNDTVIRIKNCQAITWIDGNTYSETTSTPTIALTNQHGCDSTVRLNFVLDGGLKALINVVPESATLDNLHIQLKDVSLASDARLWRFPDGRTDSNTTVYYEYPTNEDSVQIALVAIRNYLEFGSHCYDTAYVTIPLLKEAIWFPNAFTPGRDNNYAFKIMGIGIMTLEVDIYDRRGNFVYHYEGPEGFWDGKTADGTECMPGSYIYIAKYTSVLSPRNPQTHKGSVLLVK